MAGTGDRSVDMDCKISLELTQNELETLELALMTYEQTMKHAIKTDGMTGGADFLQQEATTAQKLLQQVLCALGRDTETDWTIDFD